MYPILIQSLSVVMRVYIYLAYLYIHVQNLVVEVYVACASRIGSSPGFKNSGSPTLHHNAELTTWVRKSAILLMDSPWVNLTNGWSVGDSCFTEEPSVGKCIYIPSNSQSANLYTTSNSPSVKLLAPKPSRPIRPDIWICTNPNSQSINHQNPIRQCHGDSYE